MSVQHKDFKKARKINLQLARYPNLLKIAAAKPSLPNLDKLLDVKRFRVLASPLKLKADAAPARVVAEVLD